MMIVAFLVIATALGTLIYLVLVHGSVPGSVDERLGQLEPLPPDLGKWVEDADSEAGQQARAAGLLREVRHLHEPASGLWSKECVVRQVRYRDARSGEIERVDREERLVRRRIKRPSA